MAALAEVYVKLETLETLVQTLKAKQEKGINLTVNIDDEAKVFEGKEGKKTYQNASVFVSQSKEQREEKKPRFYVGNGGVFWNNGLIKNARPQEGTAPAKVEQAEVITNIEDLPF
jgi:hypothetical protein